MASIDDGACGRFERRFVGCFERRFVSRGARRVARRLAVAWLTILTMAMAMTATAADSPSPSTVRRELDRAAQAAATAAYVARRWADGTVPAHYARDTLRAASDALSTALPDVARDAAGLADASAQTATIDDARRRTDALVTAVERVDPRAATTAADALDAIAKRLRSAP